MVSINAVGAGWSSAVSNALTSSMNCVSLGDLITLPGDNPAEEEKTLLSSALGAAFSCFSPIFADF